MLTRLFYLALAFWTAWLIREYRATGDSRHLQSAGTVVLALTFFLSMGIGLDAVLFPGKWKYMYAALLPGAIAGGLLLAAGCAGWRKALAGAQALAFLLFTAFLARSLVYFEKVRVYQYAGQQAAKAVPGLPGNIRILTPEKKAGLSGKLIQALPGAQDRFLRIGIINKLADLPDYAGPALPAVIALVPAADEYELRSILALLKTMGPAAAPAIAVLSEREGEDDMAPSEKRRIEETIKAITPEPGPRTI